MGALSTAQTIQLCDLFGRVSDTFREYEEGLENPAHVEKDEIQIVVYIKR